MSAIDPVIVGGAVVAIAIIAAGAYATLTNGEASVDFDGDDEPDVVFGGGSSDSEDEKDPLEDLYVHDDLTIIDGVGPTTSERLKAAGFQTVEDVANATIPQLTEVEGVGEARATNLSVGAARALDAAAE